MTESNAYFAVVGSFTTKQAAMRHLRDLKKKDIGADVAVYPPYYRIASYWTVVAAAYAQFHAVNKAVERMAALREVIERKGVFCALYSDRASHFFVTSHEWPAKRNSTANCGTRENLAGRSSSSSIRGNHRSPTIVNRRIWRGRIDISRKKWYRESAV